MPTDLTPIVVAKKDRITTEKLPDGRTRVFDPTALAKVVVEVIKVNFPQALSTSDAKIDPTGTKDYKNTAEYDWWQNKININPDRTLQGRYGTSVGQTFDASGKKTYEQVNFTAQDVMESVNVLLHELYHSRSKAGYRGASKERVASYGLTSEKLAKVNELQQDPYNYGSFSSINTRSFDQEEFLANADAILKLKSIGGIVAGSPTDNQYATLQKILKQVPEVQKLIDAYERPDVPEIKPLADKPAPVVTQILDLIKSKLP